LIKNPEKVVQIGENFIKNANYHSFFSNFEVSDLCFNFCTLISSKEYSTISGIRTNNNAILLGTGIFIQNIRSYNKAIDKRFKEKSGIIFQRVTFQENIFHTADCSTSIKINDSIIETKKNKIVKILDFILIE